MATFLSNFLKYILVYYEGSDIGVCQSDWAFFCLKITLAFFWEIVFVDTFVCNH